MAASNPTDGYYDSEGEFIRNKDGDEQEEEDDEFEDEEEQVDFSEYKTSSKVANSSRAN